MQPADPNRTRVPATFVDLSERRQDYCAPGALQFYGDDESALALACPGCGWTSGISVGRKDKPHMQPSWLLKGQVPNITLLPSLDCIGCCKWHGWLIHGVFYHVSDPKLTRAKKKWANS